MPVVISSDLSTIFARVPKVRVKTASSLAGTWTLREHLYLDQLTDAASPEIGQATLTFYYGDMLNPMETAFSGKSPLDIEGVYIHISMRDWDVAGDGNDLGLWDADANSPALADGVGTLGDYYIVDTPGLTALDSEFSWSIGDAVYFDGTRWRKGVEWYGIIEVDTRTPHGSRGGVSSGVQTIVAYDLKRLLEKHIVAKSVVEDAAGTATFTINEGRAFNDDENGEFSWRGNMSDNPYDGAYVFSYKQRSGNEWTAITALRYLLINMADEIASGVTWLLDVSGSSLDWNPTSSVPTDRQNLKSLIDNFIPRFRGVGWWLSVIPGSPYPTIVINVFSYADTLVNMPDGTTFLPNPNQFSLDFEQSFDIADCTVENKRLSTYHKVVVEGEYRTVTCSMRLGGGVEYVADWDISDEAAWSAGASGASWYAAATREQQNKANREVRDSDALSAVYRRFRLADDWDLTVPYSETDGTVVTLPGFQKIKLDAATAPADAFVEPLEDEAIWIPGLRILDRLPLRERYDYSGTHIEPAADWDTTAVVEEEPPFLRPFAFAQTGVPRKTGTTYMGEWNAATNTPALVSSTGNNGEYYRVSVSGSTTLDAVSTWDARQIALFTGGVWTKAAADIDSWENLDKVDDATDVPGKRKWSVAVEPLNDRSAIKLEVRRGKQQFIADSDFANLVYPAVYDREDDPDVNEGINWQDVWVTATYELPERTRIERVLTAPAAGEQERILRIPIKNCRLDYVAQGTVVAIDAGALKQVSTEFGFVRDDRYQLDNYATAAALWYSRTRQTLKLTYKQVRKIVDLGGLIVDVGPTYQKTSVNSVVTAITYDMNSKTTRWETSYADLDLA